MKNEIIIARGLNQDFAGRPFYFKNSDKHMVVNGKDTYEARCINHYFLKYD